MQFAEPEILELTQGIWISVLNMEIQADSQQPIPESLSASVDISGGWEGKILLEGSPNFARRAAAVMFDMPSEDVSLNEMIDAVAELANMVGGNLKSILPGPSTLSLPEFTRCAGERPMPAGVTRVTEVAMSCDAEPIRVTVFKK